MSQSPPTRTAWFVVLILATVGCSGMSRSRPPCNLRDVQNFVTQADLDKDGMVSRREFANSVSKAGQIGSKDLSRTFIEYDENHDKEVTSAEMVKVCERNKALFENQ